MMITVIFLILIYILGIFLVNLALYFLWIRQFPKEETFGEYFEFVLINDSPITVIFMFIPFVNILTGIIALMFTILTSSKVSNIKIHNRGK